MTRKRDPSSETLADRIPFFTAEDGSAWSTADSAALAKAVAEALDLPAADFGGKSFRIGGATDLWEALGEEPSKLILKMRGRWASDVAMIYQRALVSTLLDASAALGGAGAAPNRELEVLAEGWTQPGAA